MWPHSNVTQRYKNLCTNSHGSGTNIEYDFMLSPPPPKKKERKNIYTYEKTEIKMKI